VSSTRLLVLGCVRTFQPVHGYEVRRELISWNADQWANINYGSIYHALNQLTKEGFLEVAGTEQAAGKPARTVYQLTRVGEEEFFRLLREAAWTPAPPVVPFAVVITFIDELEPDEAVRILKHSAQWCRSTAENLHATAAAYEVSDVPSDGKPWMVPELLELNAGQLGALADWTERLSARYERGEVPTRPHP
jgi:DNA-binding PadR family transcriptional regulator